MIHPLEDLKEKLSYFSGHIDDENIIIGNYAQACVLLFIYQLKEEGGFTTAQNVYSYSLGYEPETFLKTTYSPSVLESGEINTKLIISGSIGMLLADLKDNIEDSNGECISIFRKIIARPATPLSTAQAQALKIISAAERYEEKEYSDIFLQGLQEYYAKEISHLFTIRAPS